VDAGTQKARDESRRKILEDELAAEQRSLSDARAKLADQGDAAQRKPLQESVERHERNVAALQRELSNLK
jgi:bacterioferritin (cytochrome b1)